MSCHTPRKIEPIKDLSAVYTCPMHPEVEQIGPGFCPICGMALEPKSQTDEADDSEYRDMLRRFWIAVSLTLPVLLLSTSGLFSEKYSLWFQLLLSTPVVLYTGWPFFERAWASIVHRSLNMFSLIALGVGTAYFYSVLAVLFPDLFPSGFKENGKLFVYFEAAAVITTLVLLGQVLELKARGKTSQAIRGLINQGAKTAHLLIDGQEKEIPIEQVKVNEVLRVKPGEKVPVDGVVLEGFSFVDESLVTGESMPVSKKPDSLVIGGTINQSGSFLMRAEKVGSETLLARIIQLVSEAQRSKAPIQKLADAVSSYFVPFVIAIALLTFILWAIFGPEPRLVYALLNAVAVLIISCPCALGLATPMSVTVGLGKGAEMGILIKNAEALETLEKVNTIVLDKTGTLTEGKPEVTKIITAPGWAESDLLKIAASLETNSEHPLALALVNEAKKKKLSFLKTLEFQSSTGEGVSGIIEGKKVLVGNPFFLQKNGIQIDSLDEVSKTQIYVAVNGQAAGSFVIADPIKPSAKKAVDGLHRLGLKVIMLTGDRKGVAVAVAKELQIDAFYAEVNPKDKHEIVKRLKSEGKIVAFAGDGINDSPALAAASVGIAMGTGADIAIESAGVTLVKGDLEGILRAIDLSRQTMRNIRQNLFLAFIYNFVSIPIAAGLFYPFFHLLLNPMIASGAMTLSSLSVILNALRLKTHSFEKQHN